MSPDPYVYPGMTVLKNIPGIRNQEILDRFEADRVGQRSLELIECPLSGLFDIEHLRGIHRYPFQDVYEWAGEFRTVDIAKGNSYFAHVPYIESTLKDLVEKLSEEQHLRGLDQERFASRVAEILGTLNAVRAFGKEMEEPSENSSESSHTETAIGLIGTRFHDRNCTRQATQVSCVVTARFSRSC